MLPNGSAFGCATCHISSFGGGPRNPFGIAVGALVSPGARTPFWTPTLAALDSDGDGFTNGQELGDPEGDGTAIAGWKATAPGLASSKPVNQVPSITLAVPPEGTSLVAPAVLSLSATAADPDGSVALVEFFSNGTLLGAVRQAPYSLLVDWALGDHAVTARVTDNFGATTLSSALSMTVAPPAGTSLAMPVVAGGSATLSWSGGGGPFAVQKKATLEDPWCVVSEVTAERSVVVPARGASGLLRVADLATGEAIPMTAILSGAFERPNAVAGAGRGSGTFRLLGSTLSFDIQYSGLSGAATAAHIHGPADTESAAGVLINLAPFNGGAFGTAGTFSGSIILTPAQKAAVLSGKTYVNVHTAANAAGEIRGQIVPALLQTVLAGANERPAAVSSGGTGGGAFLLTGDQLTFAISYSGLGGTASAAHIHGPADAEGTAGVMIDLAPFQGGPFGTSGAFHGTVALTPEQLLAVSSGRAYVNVHTEANRAGEIRGQIAPSVTAIPFSVSLAGVHERPEPVPGAGTGTGILALEGDTLHFHLRYSGLSGAATAAHLHGAADVNSNAGVMIDLKPFHLGPLSSNGVFAGSVTLTTPQRAAVISGLTYMNVHTAGSPAGEVRGQVAPALLTASLSGAAERPNPITTTGAGSGHFLKVLDRLWLNVSYSALSGPATASHIHGPADASATAGVVLDLGPFHQGAFGVTGSFAGFATLSPAAASAVTGGLGYVNVHTAANPSGEVRGQLIRPVRP